ncbi:MAG: hypothetical protein JST01_10365 [Cyanobacteria bacterium SZAS TMP-1]|nr:hypothetical protein [Cyanobacteria bacterium SZAS TMP-1]
MSFGLKRNLTALAIVLTQSLAPAVAASSPAAVPASDLPKPIDPIMTAPHIPIKPLKGRTRSFATPIFEKLTDPQSDELSPDAVQLARLLGIWEEMHRLAYLQKATAALPAGEKLILAEREEERDIKLDILTKVEETRLQIDFVVAEIDEEQVILEEAMRIFQEDRDNRVNRANQLAFRTNGVLWAVAEALTIPSYKYPTLSVPSGTVGIVAGIVPSLFSGYATRASGGGRYERKCYPNILTKLFDLPAIPRIDFPDVVWQFLNSAPCGDTRTRKQVMQEHWRDDQNIHIFKDGVDSKKISILTGNQAYVADMTLISDKLIMMGQVRAVALQMSRPLLEICMMVRGKKHMADTPSP